MAKKKVTIELSEKDQKWVMAALRKKKAEEQFFNAAWRRREELVEDWKEREKIAALKAKQKAEKEAKRNAEEQKEVGDLRDEPKACVGNAVDKGKG